MDISPVKPGLWKMSAKHEDGTEETFAVTNPDHAANAQTARDGKSMVTVFYHPNEKKTKMIDGLEPKG